MSAFSKADTATLITMSALPPKAGIRERTLRVKKRVLTDYFWRLHAL
jgi:hypothetical protein